MTQEEVIQILTSPNKDVKTKLEEAIKYEDRLSLHTSANYNNTRGKNTFTTFVADLLPEDKAATFGTLFRSPVATLELVDEVFSALAKVFNGKNPVFRTDAKENVLKDIYNSEDWRRKAWVTYREIPSSVIIVDKKEVEGNIQSFYYFVPVDAIRYLKVDASGDIEYIGYMAKDDLVFIDSEFYRVIRDEKIISENPHKIGYCPAKHLVQDRVNANNELLKANPLSKKVNELDWLLFQKVSSQYAELYMPYPVYWGIEQECNFAEGDIFCDSGVLRTNDAYLYTNNLIRKCPKCSSRITGVGSFVDVPIDKEIPTPPVGYVPADTNAYTALMEAIATKEQKIYAAATGNYMESINDKAVNEKQVMSLHESRLNALEQVKGNFEDSEAWTLKTLYVSETGIEPMVHISYGTSFYLTSTSEAVESYVSARDEGLSDIILDELQDEVFSLKYKNDPEKLSKHEALKDVDTLKHVTHDRVMIWYDKELIDYNQLYLHLNFSSLVKELEGSVDKPISEIGEGLSHAKRTEMIREALFNLITVKDKNL